MADKVADDVFRDGHRLGEGSAHGSSSTERAEVEFVTKSAGLKRREQRYQDDRIFLLNRRASL